MWFLTAGPVVGIPLIVAELPERKNCGSFFKKHYRHNSLTCTVASSLVCTSPLAVMTVVGLPGVLMVCNSAELRSRLLTICILAPESTAISLSSGSFVDAAGSAHSSVGEWNVALSFSLSLYMFQARFHALLRAHRYCLSVSSWDWSSNFIAWGLR